MRPKRSSYFGFLMNIHYCENASQKFAPTVKASRDLFKVSNSKHLLALRPQIRCHHVELNESFRLIDSWFSSDQWIRWGSLVLRPWDEKQKNVLDKPVERTTFLIRLQFQKLGGEILTKNKTRKLQRQSCAKAARPTKFSVEQFIDFHPTNIAHPDIDYQKGQRRSLVCMLLVRFSVITSVISLSGRRPSEPLLSGTV